MKLIFKKLKNHFTVKNDIALTVPNVVDFIKQHSNCRKKTKYFINCSIMDMTKVCIEYNLKPKIEETYSYVDFCYSTYEYYKSAHKSGEALLAVSKYDQYSLLVKINRTLFLLKDTGRNLNKGLDYDYNPDNVYLDIETTGLNYLTDDIVSLALYQPSTGKAWSTLLPLEKRQNISEEAAAVNHLTKEMLADKIALTQEHVDYLINYFDLAHNNIIIWTGKRLFDAIFLQLYFYTHNLVGFDTLKFINAKARFKNQYSDMGNYSKDYIAMLYNIDLTESHTALGDCKIVSKICENLQNNIQFRDFAKERNEISTLFNIVIDNFDLLSLEEAQTYYNSLTAKCKALPEGRVTKDYDLDKTKQPSNRHRHHIDEDFLDNIAQRTIDALEANDAEALLELKQYNKADRLVYLTIEQHFIIHCLIEKIRVGKGGGPHYLFAGIWSNDKIISLYKKVLAFEKLNNKESLQNIAERFWLKANSTLTKTAINTMIKLLLSK